MSDIDDNGPKIFQDSLELTDSPEVSSGSAGNMDTGLMGPGHRGLTDSEDQAESAEILPGEEAGFSEDDPLDPDAHGYGDDSEIGFIVIDSQEGGGSGEPEDVETPEYAPDEVFPVPDMAYVVEQLSGLSRQVEQLSQDFESKLKYDSHKEKIIDSLHGELQEHKDGLLKKHIQSMVMDIVKVIDDVRKIVRHYREKDLSESDLPKILDILEDLPSDLEDAFSFQGIRPYTCEGDTFNPARQRVLQKIDTEDESLDKKVAKRLLPGYEWDDNILRLEMVGVYTFKPVSEND